MSELYFSIREKKFYSLSEVAALCEVTPAAALYWCRQGWIRDFERPSLRGKYRIPRKEVIRLLGERGIEVPGLWTSRKRILVIDEYAAVTEFIRFTLEHAGIQVELRSSGTVGNALVMAGAMKPDLIIVDYGSPAAEFQGLQALSLIRQATLLKNARVIGMATAPRCARRMRVAGAVEFLLKPFEPEELVRAVRRTLKLREPSRRAESRRP